MNSSSSSQPQRVTYWGNKLIVKTIIQRQGIVCVRKGQLAQQKGIGEPSPLTASGLGLSGSKLIRCYLMHPVVEAELQVTSLVLSLSL